MSGRELVELTKEKLVDIKEVTARIRDKARGGYYEIRPISKTKLATILTKVKITMPQLRKGDFDLSKQEELEDLIIQASLKGWTLEEVKKHFPKDMKEPVAWGVLRISNLGIDPSKLDEFFLEKPVG